MNASSTKGSEATIPLRYLCELNPSVSFEEFEEDDDLTFLPMDRVKSGYFIANTAKASRNCSSYSSFAEGDIILAKVTPCFENGNIAIAENLVGGKGFGSSELFVIRPKNIDVKFLFYCFQSSNFKQEGEASMTGAGGLKRVSPDVLRHYRSLQLTPEIQRKIANYLDHETSEINELIREKEGMLALLEEKRSALISHLVTRGVNAKVTLKDSGIDWLPQVPKSWEIVRAKALFREIDDRTSTGEEELLSLRMGVGLVAHSGVSDKELTGEDIVGYKRVKAGQLVINRMRAAMGLIAVSPQDGLVSPDYAVFDIIRLIHVPFYLLLFKTSLMGALFRSSSKGLGNGSQGFLRLYTENFLALHLPVPPMAEQIEIQEHLDKETAASQHLTAELEASITLLRERRAALITAAVTGQIPLNQMKP